MSDRIEGGLIAEDILLIALAWKRKQLTIEPKVLQGAQQMKCNISHVASVVLFIQSILAAEHNKQWCEGMWRHVVVVVACVPVLLTQSITTNNKYTRKESSVILPPPAFC